MTNKIYSRQVNQQYVVVYHSTPGQPNPVEYISGSGRKSPQGASNLLTFFDRLSSAPREIWPGLITKIPHTKSGKIFQKNLGPHRALFFEHKGYIVIVHAFKKTNLIAEQNAYRLADLRRSDFLQRYEEEGYRP
jgi:hypothetical protein